jgi:hypothetical protein
MGSQRCFRPLLLGAMEEEMKVKEESGSSHEAMTGDTKQHD